MDTTVQPNLRIQANTYKLSDMIPPIMTGMGSYAFIVSRMELPPVFEKAFFYLSWFVFGFSILMILKITIDLMTKTNL